MTEYYFACNNVAQRKLVYPILGFGGWFLGFSVPTLQLKPRLWSQSHDRPRGQKCSAL